MPERLQQQIAFIMELDKLKQISRQTFLLDGSRTENDAEHSWQIAVMALLLAEYAAQKKLDIFRVVQMLLLHDVVEIDAGDTYLYDEQAAKDKAAREARAADRLFRILPADQAREFRELWEEFEARATPEAQFAAALDRLQPLLHNYVTHGKSWQMHGVTSAHVERQQEQAIRPGAPALWEYAESLIRESEAKGYFGQK